MDRLIENRRSFLTHVVRAGIGGSLAGPTYAYALTRQLVSCRSRAAAAFSTNLLDGSARAQRWLVKMVGPVIGKLRTKPSSQIESSPFSIGLETLDRYMYDPERVYPHLGRLGVKWARLQTGWARTEKSPGKFDFSWLSEVVDAVRSLGVTPWFNVGYGNKLYMPQAPDVSAVGWVPIYEQAAKLAWLRYVRLLAKQFRDRVKHWEIWNEPNITTFWKPAEPSAKLYTEFVADTAAVIREEIPDAVIVAGALAGMPTDYLKQLLAHGIAKHAEKISYHPYRPIPEQGYRETLLAWRRLVRQASEKPVEFWQGENGCPSQPGSTGALRQFDWDETKQAKWLLRRMLYDRVLEVELTSYFHMVDLVNYNWGTGPSGKTNFKGLLRGEDYSPKPSYYAYKRLCTLLNNSAVRDSNLDSAVMVRKEAVGSEINSSERAKLIGPAAFVRKNAPIWCIWYATDLFQDTPVRELDVAIRQHVLRSDRLVFCDLLSGCVYRISNLKSEKQDILLEAVPVGDYPVIIADIASIEDVTTVGHQMS